MSSIDDTLDDVAEATTEFLNSDGRSAAHVALGIAVTAGFAILATALATGAIKPRRTPRHLLDRAGPITERPTGSLSLILPAVFSATTLSALRVWNAPSRPGRNRSLGLWAVAQGVNALWLAARPSTLTGQMAAAFAHEARKLDDGTGKIAAPTGTTVRLANLVERKIDDQRATLH